MPTLEETLARIKASQAQPAGPAPSRSLEETLARIKASQESAESGGGILDTIKEGGRDLFRGAQRGVSALGEAVKAFDVAAPHRLPGVIRDAVAGVEAAGGLGELARQAGQLPVRQILDEAVGGEEGREVPMMERAGFLLPDVALLVAPRLLRGMRAASSAGRAVPAPPATPRVLSRTTTSARVDTATRVGTGKHAGSPVAAVGGSPPPIRSQVTTTAKNPASATVTAPPPIPDSAAKVLKRGGVAPARHVRNAPQSSRLAVRAEEGGVAGARVFRTKQAEEALRQSDGIGFRDILNRFGDRYTPEEIATAMTRVVSDDAGYAHRGLMASIAGGGAGATAGIALYGDDPDAWIGATVAMGLAGAIGAPKLLHLAGSEPGRARQLFASIGRGIQTIRAEAALSGLAAPKNVASAIGAPVTAAIEKGSARPFLEAARIPTNAKNFFRGAFTQPIDIGMSTGRARGPFSRLISGIDFSAEEMLKRSGMTQAEANRILLKTPLEELMGPDAPLLKALRSPTGQVFVLFQRTPTNVFSLALSEPSDLFRAIPNVARGEAVRRRVATAGTIATGALSGLVTEDMDPYQRILVLGLMAAFFGPRTGVFAGSAGAGAVAGGGSAEDALRAAGGIVPFPEFGFDPQAMVGTITEPSGLRVINRLGAPQPLDFGSGRRNTLGSFSQR